MKEWIEQLSSREQRLLIAAAAILLVLLFYVLVWQPLSRNHARLAGEVAESREELAWMRAAAMEARLLEGGGKPPAGDTRSLIARTTAELRADGIEAARIQPEGDDRLRLGVETVAFTRLLGSLDRLQVEYGIRVEEIVLEPVPGSSGMVTARLLLQRTDQ